MSKLDRTKEQIAYLKLWLGILIATIVSLTGWLISNFNPAYSPLSIAAISSLLILCLGGYRIHRHIEAKITSLEDL